MTSVMYGIGIEAAGAEKPLPPGNWEKLRLRVVAIPLRRRHAARCVFMVFEAESRVVGGLRDVRWREGVLWLNGRQGSKVGGDLAYSRAESYHRQKGDTGSSMLQAVGRR